MLTVKAVNSTFSVFIGGQECKAEACDFSVLPLDYDILRFDVKIAVLVELNDLVDSNLPWQASHLNRARTIRVIELVSQAYVLELGPILGC